MKNSKILRGAVALSIALTTTTICHAAQSTDTEASGTQSAGTQAIGQTASGNLADLFQQIRADVKAAKTASPEMLTRLDEFVSKIDLELQTKPANATALETLRGEALQLRSQISKSLGYEIGFTNQLETQSMMGNMVPAPINGTVMSDTVIGEQVIGSTPMSSGSFSGGFSGGGGGLSGGGGGGGSFGGGGGGLVALGLGAAGLAVGISNDNDNPGTPASPSR